MKAIVVGAGGTARELLRRLGEVWDEVVVVDTSEELLAQAGEVRELIPLVGDGSSRAVLNRAGLGEADALVAAAGDDETNLEACRLARDAGVLRIAAVAATPERLSDYRALEVPAFSPASLAARQVELHLETRRIASTAFADGRAEAIEFRVEQDTPVRGKALKDLRARSWLVGSILRRDRLIIPHGDTVLEPGDLVTVVGSATDFGSMVRSFTSGRPRFPMEFGKRVALALTGPRLEAAFAEAVHLARNSRATSLLVVYRDPASGGAESERIAAFLGALPQTADGVTLHMRPVRKAPIKALADITREESVGVVVVPTSERLSDLRRKRASRLLRLARTSRVPVLFARGTQPYGRILLPARRTQAGRAAARAAIDIARTGSSELVGLAAVEPHFIAGTTANDEAKRALAWLQEEAAVQGIKVSRKIRQGNPVRTFVDLAADADLAVLGLAERSGPRRLQVQIAHHVARRAPVSVLAVPVLE